MQIEFLRPMTACILSERRAVRPFGIMGGGAALAGINLLLTADGRQVSLGGKNDVQLKGGERLRILTPGGTLPSMCCENAILSGLVGDQLHHQGCRAVRQLLVCSNIHCSSEGGNVCVTGGGGFGEQDEKSAEDADSTQQNGIAKQQLKFRQKDYSAVAHVSGSVARYKANQESA